MINALTARISGKEPRVSAEALRSYCGDSVIQNLHCGAILKKKITASKLKMVTVLHSATSLLLCCSRWIRLMPVYSEDCLECTAVSSVSALLFFKLEQVFINQAGYGQKELSIKQSQCMIVFAYDGSRRKINSLIVFVGILLGSYSFVLHKRGNTVSWCDSYSQFLHSLLDYFDVCSPRGSCSCWRCSEQWYKLYTDNTNLIWLGGGAERWR